MAGRSGAAAIEMELRETAKHFSATRLARAIRAGDAPDHALADALEAVGTTMPQIERREGEIFLAFCIDTQEPTRKVDCTAIYGALCGTEVHMLHERALGVSLYLE